MEPIRTSCDVSKISMVCSYHPEEIYKQLPLISVRLTKRRLRLAGHCFRAEGEAVSRLLLFSPCHHPVKSRKVTFLAILSRDSGLERENINAAMDYIQQILIVKDVFHSVDLTQVRYTSGNSVRKLDDASTCNPRYFSEGTGDNSFSMRNPSGTHCGVSPAVTTLSSL